MSLSDNEFWIESIRATKERKPLITASLEPRCYNIIQQQFKVRGCPARIIIGMLGHVHCLFLLIFQKSISEVIKQMKGGSSHGRHQNDLLEGKFAW